MQVTLVGRIVEIRTIAIGRRIRDRARLQRTYGSGPWRKRAGLAWVRLRGGSVRRAEVHWYEAHGVGRKELKIKRLIGDIE